MKKSTSFLTKIGSGAAGLLLLLLIIGAVVFILGNLRMRFDLTSDRLYTLSGGSRAVLDRLDREVKLKLYFSRSSAEVPMIFKSYARQVEDLLKEYELAGKGNIVVEIHDPAPDSEAEEWAQRYGIAGQPTGMFSPPMYFGVVATCGSGDTVAEEVLPALSPQTEAMLEYDLTRLITRVSTSGKPVIGVMSTLPVLGQSSPPQMMMMPPRGGSKPWVAFGELKRDFDVRQVETTVESIDADITTLVVVHPKNLSDKTLFAIDQFVLRGGRLLAFVDPFSVADLEAGGQNQMAMYGMGGGQGPSTLGKLFDAWGIGFDTGKVMADMRAATRLGGNGRVEESPIFLSLGRSNMSSSDLLTAQLDQVMLPFAGELVDNTPEGITFTPLLSTSSDASCPVDAMAAQFGMQAAARQTKPDGRSHVLAARLTGTFKTAFPDGAPRDPEAGTNTVADTTHLTVASSPGVIVVVGDADFVADRFCVQSMGGPFGFQAVQPINDNIALLANSVEQLSGSADLIAIRSRGRSARPFDKVDQLEAKAMLAWQAEEERLNDQLNETRRKLSELQQQKQGAQKFVILSPEQEETIRTFQREEADVKARLKTVRKSLRRDIEQLGRRVKLANIAAVPLLVVIFGVLRAVFRRRV